MKIGGKRKVSRSSLRPLVIALPLVLAGLPVLAQDSGWYAGLSGGRSEADLDANSISRAVGANGVGTREFALDDQDTAWKILGGYDFNRLFALEFSYFDLGDYAFNTALRPAGTLGGSSSVDGLALDLVATLPLRGSLALLARAGINNASVDQNFRSTAPGTGLVNRSERDVNEKYGLGLEYSINDAFSIRAEWERYGLERTISLKDHAEVLSVGFVYRFGRSAPPPPAPVVQAPPPQPEPAPEPMRVTLAASALFDFDRAELRPEGRQELDEFLRDIEGLDYDVVLVIGHTDRIGTRSYNLALSQRRAEAVRNYLVQGGIPAASISARGVNSDEPVTRPEQCTGPVNDALKACLQPDRRVVIEVTGLRMPE